MPMKVHETLPLVMRLALAVALAVAVTASRMRRCRIRSPWRSGTPAFRCPACRSSSARRAPTPLIAHDADRPRNPASVMKLVTTYAALDLLGRDFRWRTEAYLAGKLGNAGTLNGNLVLKGYGDPKITIEQWQAFMADLRARGLTEVTGDLVLDRTYFKLPEHDPAAFDQEPLQAVQRRPRRAARQFQGGALRVRAGRHA